MPYAAPLRDIAFALYDVAGFDAVLSCAPYAQFDRETIAAVLDGAGAFARDALAPLNRSGDREGARFENGAVRAPAGFGQAYKSYVAGGWGTLSADPQFGGQGLPGAVELCVFEMIHSANMAFGLCPMLTRGAIESLAKHGADQQRRRYLPKLVSGEWTGAMNLTEPQAGSDLANVNTRALAQPDGTYSLTGQKIFITWGDHDLTENIVHLVLARTPDAPAGTHGLSLFVAAKRLVGADGSVGDRNRVYASRIEHKLGIHASPTCAMTFDGASAELIGERNNGLAQMFTMMNAARLQVGVEGVAIAQRAYQQALSYALQRRQGRSAWTGEMSAPIFDHPDVRRTLMRMKAKIDAARAICLATGVAADLEACALTQAQRDAARLRHDILTPIAKAWSTNIGVEAASDALQIHGGAGFVEETGAAQYYRDARIGPIYEGANGIQAIDLVARKIPLEGGRAIYDLLVEISALAAMLAASQDGGLQTIGARLSASAHEARKVTDWMLERKGHASADALAGASAYLEMLGNVLGGWMLAKGAQRSAIHLAQGGDDADLWWRTRLGLAKVFADTVLSSVTGLATAATAGALDLARTTPQALGSQ